MDSAQLVEFFFEQINQLRKNPKSIQHLLQDRLSRLVKEQDVDKQINCYSHYEFGNVLFKTIEGDKPVKEALSFIEQQPRVRALCLNEKLCEVAYQIGVEMQREKKEIDLTAYKELIRRELRKQMPEIKQKVQILVDYGFRKDVDLLTNIMIDDGNYDRSRRHTLMNETWQSVGISVHQHYEFDYFIVFLFSSYLEPIAGCSCELM